ncbi:MAG TPA: hypothetical protein VII36_02860 [Usitatibacter sp.]
MNLRATFAVLATAVIGGAFALPAGAADSTPDRDAALALASDRLDLAEHALAVARKGTSSRREGLHMIAPRRSQGDVQRAAFYMRSVLLARSQLLELRQAPPAAEPALEQLASR